MAENIAALLKDRSVRRAMKLFEKSLENRKAEERANEIAANEERASKSQAARRFASFHQRTRDAKQNRENQKHEDNENANDAAVKTARTSNLLTTSDETLLLWRQTFSNYQCGSRYYEAIAEALIELELPDVTVGTPSRAQGVHLADALQSQKMLIDLSGELYGEFLTTVKRTLEDENVQAKMGALHIPEEFNHANSEDTGTVDGLQINSTDQSIPMAAAMQLVRHWAIQYLRSNPGQADSQGQCVESDCRALLVGKSFADAPLNDLARKLRYRLYGVMKQATDYKNHLQLEFPDCENVDWWQWYNKQLLNRWTKYDKKHHDYALRQVTRAQLFDKPGVGDGLDYRKGRRYLAILLTVKFAENHGAMDDAVEKMKSYKVKSLASFRTVRDLELHKCPNIMEGLESFAQRARGQLVDITPPEESQLQHHVKRS